VVGASEADPGAFDATGGSATLAESDRRVRGNLAVIGDWAARAPAGYARRLVVRFWLRPVRVEGTDLGLVRTGSVTIVSVTTHQRPRKEKFDFNVLLCRKLQERCGIAPTDVVINFVVNAFEDWSFGEGEPHYIRGPLAQT